MEHLIIKYLNNELSQEEWQELRQWLEESDLNKTTLNNLKSFSSNINYEVSELEELVWQELSEKRRVNSVSSIRKIGRPLMAYFKVAAVLLVVSAFALFAYQLAFKTDSYEDPITLNTIHKVALPGQKMTTRLPDGSIVTLNSGSRISFPDQFIGNSREVVLSGEAFFEVKRNPNKPFYVKMDGDKVRVLGTSFNIRSYPEDDAVYVSVATGRVSYTIPSGKEVILESEQMATYDRSNGSLSKGTVDKLQAFGWKDKIVYFKGITFENLTRELERWYGVKIIANDNFGARGTYSGEFDNPTLSEILHSLSFVYRFKFEIEGNKVILNKITN